MGADRAAPDELLTLILDTIPQAVWWKDRDSVYLGCNVPFARAAGLSHPSQIVGLTDFDLGLPVDIATQFREVDARVMASGLAEYHMLEDLLDHGRLHAGTFKLKVGEHDLTATVNEVIGGLTHQAQSQGLDLVVGTGPASPRPINRSCSNVSASSTPASARAAPGAASTSARRSSRPMAARSASRASWVRAAASGSACRDRTNRSWEQFSGGSRPMIVTTA